MLNRLFVNPTIYFLSGHLVMIGVAAVLLGDIDGLLLLLKLLMAFVTGWFLMNLGLRLATRTHNTHAGYPSAAYRLHRNRRKERLVALVLLMLLLIVLVIAVRYGLPIFSVDPTLARVKQRQYMPLMVLIEYLLPAVAGVAYLSSRETGKKYLLWWSIFIAFFLSTAMAVRYIFLEVLVVVTILSFMHNRVSRNFKTIVVAVVFGILFFALIQVLRSDSFELDFLINKLSQRFFYISHAIFDVTAHWNLDLPYPTYLGPIFKLVDYGRYNIGFILFDKIEPGRMVQGYAPPSLAGEVLMNVGQDYEACLLMFSIASFVAILVYLLRSFVRSAYRPIFDAFLCMEMFRAYAHTLFGMLLALTVFWVILIFFGRLTEEKKRISSFPSKLRKRPIMSAMYKEHVKVSSLYS